MMATPDDAFTARMFEALNAMMLDMLAAIARKDYDDRRRRQMQGIHAMLMPKDMKEYVRQLDDLSDELLLRRVQH
jgi:DNA invertase Pin-like site-specific DNA recombinase